MPLLFAATLFLSAALLFLIQPILARMVLPNFGGASAVWTTCMLFFQGALLAGYGYAHLHSKRLTDRAGYAIHVALMLAPLALLPIAFPSDWTPSVDHPATNLLFLLLFYAGLPFLLVSTTAPLLQRWYARSDQAGAHDPYYLYAASNAGSLLALLGYPFFVEPGLPLDRQTQVWAFGYGLLILLVAVCAIRVGRSPAQSESTAPAVAAKSPKKHQSTEPRPSAWTRGQWVLLAFVPSSLLLGCTNYLSTDVASIPFLWVMPLALYLSSFILAFSSMRIWTHQIAVCVLPFALLYQTTQMLEVASNMEHAIAVHLTTLFVASTACHGQLAKTRPPAEHLTEFYFWMSLGGSLGGLFNAIIAPLLFNSLLEYPLALALSALVLPPLFVRREPDCATGKTPRGKSKVRHESPTRFSPTDNPSLLRLNRLIPVMLATAIIGASLWGDQLADESLGVVYSERTFFGVLRIGTSSDGLRHTLLHGRVRHGTQFRGDDPAQRRRALAYYTSPGPIGQFFNAFRGPIAKQRVAVIGLGVGSIAAYGEQDQDFTFYEIDPAVERLALDKRYFSFLADAQSRGVKVRVVIGDGRLSLRRETAAPYGLIVVDAFSGDAIPVHLLTREALRLYKDHLADGGVIAFHITNDFVNLEPIVAELAKDAGLVGLVQRDDMLTEGDERMGKERSVWVLLARQRQDLAPLSGNPAWRSIERKKGVPLWTDQYSNVLREVFRKD